MLSETYRKLVISSVTYHFEVRNIASLWWKQNHFSTCIQPYTTLATASNAISILLCGFTQNYVVLQILLTITLDPPAPHPSGFCWRPMRVIKFRCPQPKKTLLSLSCTYVHVKPKIALLNIVAPPGSHPHIRSILTKSMLQTFHLDPILEVLYEEVGLWVEWWWSLPPLNLSCTYVHDNFS